MSYQSDVDKLCALQPAPAGEVLTDADNLAYLQFQAALDYFAPGHPATHADHGIYLRNKKLTDLEFAHTFALEELGVVHVNGDAALNVQQPAIYVSFHLGSYTSAPTALFARGLPMAMVLGDDAFGEKRLMFEQAALARMATHPDSTARWTAINAEVRGGVIAMMRAIRKGQSLFFYLDGNKGLQQNKDTDLVDVVVGSAAIRSRRGIAFLSHSLRVPIIPVITHRTRPNRIEVDILPRIIPSGTADGYIAAATQLLWDRFNTVFQRDPLQWESLCHAYSYRPQTADHTGVLFDPDARYFFNAARYRLFANGSPLMLDGACAEPVRLSQGYFQLLKKLDAARVEVPGRMLADIVKDGAALARLLDQNVLIARR